MRLASALLMVAFVVACAPAEEEEAQPAGPTLADFAGTWEITAMLEGVEDSVTTTLNGTADGPWTMTLGGMDPIPVQVSIEGDSLIGQSGEYASIIREGVPVTVRVAGVLQNGMLVGNAVASYRMADGVEDVPGTFRGRRRM